MANSLEAPSAFWSQGCYTMSPEARGQILDADIINMDYYLEGKILKRYENNIIEFMLR